MKNNTIVKILQDFWPKNKAKGLLAQAILTNEIKENVFGKNGKDKFLPGCWLLAPKSIDFYKFRFSFFAVSWATIAYNVPPLGVSGDFFNSLF